MLNCGRNNARSYDICKLKEKLRDWKVLNPPLHNLSSERDRNGFYGEASAWLLCPGTMDCTDKEVLAKLQKKASAAPIDDFPKFVFRNEMVPDDPVERLDAFMYGFYVEKAMSHIWNGPSAAIAGAQSSTKPPNAMIYGIKSITLNSLAYATELVRFVLSSDGKYNEASSGNTWQYKQFHTALLLSMEQLPAKFRGKLVSYYNDTLFSHLDPEGDVPARRQGMAALLAEAASLACAREVRDLALAGVPRALNT